jgi:hypothetical protein
MLERIYENPVYAEDHPNPYRELEQIDEIVEVGLRKLQAMYIYVYNMIKPFF